MIELDAVPRLRWVDAPSPLTSLALPSHPGITLYVKRDDRLPRLFGGTKVRKLDLLLAHPPFRDAPGWCSVGAIGSGHLATLAAGAQELDRHLMSLLFWEPPSSRVLENLAYTATYSARLSYHRSRLRLALRYPLVWFGHDLEADRPFIPPGATTALGMVGLVRAGLEFGRQVASGECPRPDRVYVAFGSGGTAVGLAHGLALAGIQTEVCAVAATERPFASPARVRYLSRSLQRWWARAGLSPQLPPAVPIVFDHTQIGKGYGHPTQASRAACDLARAANRDGDLCLEEVYTGKAMAALLAHAPALAGQSILFWNTVSGPLPAADPEWRTRLPKALRHQLACQQDEPALTSDATAPAPLYRPNRRFFLVGGSALGIAGMSAYRLGGYPTSSWAGQVLSARQATILRAAAEAVLPAEVEPVALDEVPARIDAYLATLPAKMQAEVDQLLAFLEHGTLVGGHLARLTRLSVDERRAHLETLCRSPGLLGEAGRGICELVFLGYYQQPRTWTALSYTGPMLGTTPSPPSPYRRYLAPGEREEP